MGFRRGFLWREKLELIRAITSKIRVALIQELQCHIPRWLTMGDVRSETKLQFPMDPYVLIMVIMCLFA